MKLRVEYNLRKMTIGHPGAKYNINLIPISGEYAKFEIRSTTPSNN